MVVFYAGAHLLLLMMLERSDAGSLVMYKLAEGFLLIGAVDLDREFPLNHLSYSDLEVMSCLMGLNFPRHLCLCFDVCLRWSVPKKSAATEGDHA